ncbi:MAG: ethanolamine utilization protein EutJ [Tissierellia bacterium]|nr:ethanolamine utilization protein EutJ [Tissierellia bacterium]
MDLKIINEKIKEFEYLVQSGRCEKFQGELFTGVDLGTSSIVLSVIDEKGHFVAGASRKARSIRDGIVVDYLGAVKIVTELKEDLERCLGKTLRYGSAAIPPGVGEGSSKILSNILEATEFQVVSIIDEPEAAALLLGIKDGAVVDIGGGTTGISVLENGEIVLSYDEATGGHHMNLVIAGALKLDVEEAEKKKIKEPNKVFPIISPVAEKMAKIVHHAIDSLQVETVYLVGGSTDFPKMNQLFKKELNKKIIKPYKPIYVTPMGIALSCRNEVMKIE